MRLSVSDIAIDCNRQGETRQWAGLVGALCSKMNRVWVLQMKNRQRLIPSAATLWFWPVTLIFQPPDLEQQAPHVDDFYPLVVGWG
jgi:hypothetical protein